MQKYIVVALLYNAACFGAESNIALFNPRYSDGAESYVVRLLNDEQVRLQKEFDDHLNSYERGIANMNASVSLNADAMNTIRTELTSLDIIKQQLQ